jgi:uncharacterized protein YraI
MNHSMHIAAAGLFLFGVTSAFGAEGYVTGNVNLRAGPDVSYPSIAKLRAGTTVDIQGCVDEWSWCDVSDGDDRGWIAGDFLQQEYEGRRVAVPRYGVRIGIPIVSFEFGSYWDDHYRNRSWYGQRERWSHVTPRYRGSNEQSRRGNSSQHDSRGYSHGATHSDVRVNEVAPHSQARTDERAQQNRSAYAPAQSAPRNADRHAARTEDHANSRHANSGAAAPAGGNPAATAQPVRPHAVAAHAAPAAPVPARRNDVPAQSAHEHKKEDRKEDADSRHRDPQT